MTNRNTLPFPRCGRVRRWRLRYGSDGGAEAMQGRRRCGVEAAAHGRWRSGLPAASAHPSDRLGFLWWGQKDGEPLGECPWPPPLPFMCAARRGPTSLPRAGRPRSGRESKAQLAVGPTGGDQSNILPLDLISYFNLSQSLLSSFLILYLPTPLRISAYEHAS